MLAKIFGLKEIEMISVPSYASGTDISGFLVESVPDVKKIFSSNQLPCPLLPEDGDRVNWGGRSEKEKRHFLALAYMAHPDPGIRLATLKERGSFDTIDVLQLGIDMLADESQEVAAQAARIIWSGGQELQEKAVLVLRDEIYGYSTPMPGIVANDSLRLGEEKATRALDLLLAKAPDNESKSRLQEFIDEKLVIESRIIGGDSTTVEFVETTTRNASSGGVFTYEVYRADSRDDALAFLKTKEVGKPLYYVEVDTPNGTWGKDIDGIYNV